MNINLYFLRNNNKEHSRIKKNNLKINYKAEKNLSFEQNSLKILYSELSLIG